MNLEHLRTFRRLHEVGSFGAAARELGISQPAVTYRIDRLEAELGAKLVEAPRRGVTLTREGHAVLAHAESILGGFDGLVRALSGGETPAEPFRVVAPGSVGRTLLFPILCGEEFEGVPLTLLFRSADEIFALVADGTCDVGLNYRTRTSHLLDVEEVWEEEFVLIAPPGSPPIDAGDVEEIEKQRFVTYEECDYVFGRWFETSLTRRPRRVIGEHHFARLDEVIRMVALGRGVSIVPRPACEAAAANGEVEVVEAGRPCMNPNYLVTRSGWSRSPAFEALRTALAAI